MPVQNNIAAFAKAIRAELSDLPKREIQELTEGLEADLTERFAEEGAEFPLESAHEYAADLREAAGVTPRAAKSKAFSAKALTENVETWLRKTALGNAILEFGISIRPVWWVLRAIVAWAIFAGVFYSFGDGLILLPIVIFLSVQWGRKKWFTNKFFTSLLLPLNLAATLGIIPVQEMVIRTLNNYANAEEMMRNWPGSDGLRLDGEPVTELKAFDSKNNEISGLSFKDQSGKLIELPETQVAYFPMPDIMDMTVSEANLALTQAGIPAVDIEYLDGATDKTGVVVKVYPPNPGDLVTKFDVVTVTIGKK
jgi:PASTA domain